jgi:tetratricopeptide (TPR) repeat protein
LGLGSNVSREAIERAYQSAKELVSRDRILPRVREKFRSELTLIESRLVEAYLTLTQARPGDAARSEPAAGGREPQAADDLLVRVELDKTKTKRVIEENAKVADQYHAKAKKFLREGDYYNAIQYGKLAISYAPEDARFYFLLGECQAKNPDARWQRMAEQNYLKAAELDQWNPEYRVSLGRFYKHRGLKLRARKQFEEALVLSPTHEGAQKELEALA